MIKTHLRYSLLGGQCAGNSDFESQPRKRGLIRHSQIDTQSLNDIWRQELNHPDVVSKAKPPTLEGEIAIFVGRGRWGARTDQDKWVKEDALWKSTPRKLRGVTLREIFENAATLLEGGPKWLRRETVVGGISGSGLEEAIAGSHIVSAPDLFDFYPAMLKEERTRVGGRKLAPPVTLPTSLSWVGNFIQMREERRRHPDEPWGLIRIRPDR